MEYEVKEKKGTDKNGKPYMMLFVSFKGVELGHMFLEKKDLTLIELLRNTNVKRT